MYRFKVVVQHMLPIDPDSTGPFPQMTFFIETEAGNEQAAREMIESMIDDELWLTETVSHSHPKD